MTQVALPIFSSAVGKRRRTTAPPERDARSQDATLMAAVGRGEERALAEVHATYGPAIFGVIRRVVRDTSTAEDVFQQVMTEAWRRADAFDPVRGSLNSWLLTMARSRAIDEIRRRTPEPVDPSTIAAQAGDDPTFDNAVRDWEMGQLLSRLPDDERRVLELRFRHDLSQSEIADAINLPLGTVKTRMTRGLSRLRTMLDPDQFDVEGAA